MSTQPGSLRAYPVNSGPAAARIVALAMIADGRMKPIEMATLQALRAPEQLSLTQPHWHDVIDDLCEDLIRGSDSGDDVGITAEALDHALGEVTDPALRLSVVRLCSAVATADGPIHAAESFVLVAAIERWDLSPDEAALLGPLRGTHRSNRKNCPPKQ